MHGQNSVEPMLSIRLKYLIKRLNPSAKCWYDSKKLVQSGVCCNTFSFNR
jgi:hypothetical protein